MTISGGRDERRFHTILRMNRHLPIAALQIQRRQVPGPRYQREHLLYVAMGNSPSLLPHLAADSRQKTARFRRVSSLA